MIRQRLSPRVWLASVWCALGLLGCEVTNFLPLPQQAPPAAEPQARRAAQSPTIAEMETAVRQRINEIRQQNNLNPLAENERLAQVARNYSRRMAQENFFSHTGPDGDTPAQRVRSAGITYSVVGENLFTSTNAPQPMPLAIQGWMNSPGHRENILRPDYRETGIGIWRNGNTYYFTQLFMRSLF